MDVFNNREIALLIWVIILLAFALSKSEMRESFLAVFKAFFQRAVISIIVTFYVYVGFIVFCLVELNVWDTSQIKNTLIWSVFVGIAAIFRTVTEKETKDPVFFKNWIFDNLKIIVFVEFIVSFKPFPLLVELILQPFIAFISMVSVSAEYKDEHRSARKACNAILSIVGFFIVAHAINSIWVNYNEFATMNTLRDFYTPILLSLSLTPFLYLLYVYASYERVFSALSWAIKDEGLRKYTKFHAFLSFGADIEFLDRWRRKILLSKPENRDNIRKSILDIRAIKSLEKNPPSICSSDGWSPYEAQKYIEDYGISTGDYHEQYDEWFASSQLIEIGDESTIMRDNIAYYIEGEKKAAKKLKLILSVYNSKNVSGSESKFTEIARALYKKAVSQNIPDNFDSFLNSKEGIFQATEHIKVCLLREEWQGEIEGGYTKRLFFEV